MSADIDQQLRWLRAALDELAPPVTAHEVYRGHGTDGEAASAQLAPASLGARSRPPAWLLAAAVLVPIITLGAGLWWLVAPEPPDRGVNSVADSTESDLATGDVVDAVPMVAPGRDVSPAMKELVMKPTCADADGLAVWVVEQLAWWGRVDPADLVSTDFETVTARVPVDTAETASVVCVAALAAGDVQAWGLRDGAGNWLARGAGVLDPGEFERPPQPDGRPVDGDVLDTHILGSGQLLNDFYLPADSPRDTIAGLVSFGPIVVIELSEPVVRAEPVERYYHLRTSTPSTWEGVSSGTDVRPTLVPAGFNQCTGGYVRNPGEAATAPAVSTDDGYSVTLTVIAWDYCDDQHTVVVTTGEPGIGTPRTIAGSTVYVDTVDGVVRISGDASASSDDSAPVLMTPVILAPADVPVDGIVAMFLSIPTSLEGGDVEPVSATVPIDFPPGRVLFVEHASAAGSGAQLNRALAERGYPVSVPVVSISGDWQPGATYLRSGFDDLVDAIASATSFEHAARYSIEEFDVATVGIDPDDYDVIVSIYIDG